MAFCGKAWVFRGVQGLTTNCENSHGFLSLVRLKVIFAAYRRRCTIRTFCLYSFAPRRKDIELFRAGQGLRKRWIAVASFVCHGFSKKSPPSWISLINGGCIFLKNLVLSSQFQWLVAKRLMRRSGNDRTLLNQFAYNSIFLKKKLKKFSWFYSSLKPRIQTENFFCISF